MLSSGQVETIHGDFNIPCTQGRGVGVAGGMVACITKNFIISLDAQSAMPTKHELLVLKSYLKFKIQKSYRNADQILAMDLPATAGHNTLIFIKGEKWPSNQEHGWAYRRMTWSVGPTFAPSDTVTKPCPPPWTLIQVLDHVENLVPKPWQKWKKEHPEIFEKN